MRVDRHHRLHNSLSLRCGDLVLVPAITKDLYRAYRIIRPHRMYEMWTSVTDDPVAW